MCFRGNNGKTKTSFSVSRFWAVDQATAARVLRMIHWLTTATGILLLPVPWVFSQEDVYVPSPAEVSQLLQDCVDAGTELDECLEQ